jgi:ubiquinone/menaquinone biosynthesis C-methylase UbiE
MGIAKSMRQEWDERARKDAFFYIASWRRNWNVSDFLKSGEDDYQRFVAPVLNRYGFSPMGKRMLELGCGAGRMTHVFATHFSHVTALDVSTQMLDRARQILPSVANITWAQANGADLGSIATESMDFAFSYLVLQHLPDEKLVCAYIHEMLRTLTPTGVCLFQFNASYAPNMNWKGRLGWGCVDTLWAIHLPVVSRFVARRLGFDPEMAGKSWHGTALATETVIETVNASGGTILEIQGKDTPMAWCCARKVKSSPESLQKIAHAALDRQNIYD